MNHTNPDDGYTWNAADEINPSGITKDERAKQRATVAEMRANGEGYNAGIFCTDYHPSMPARTENAPASDDWCVIHSAYWPSTIDGDDVEVGCVSVDPYADKSVNGTEMHPHPGMASDDEMTDAETGLLL